MAFLERRPFCSWPEIGRILAPDLSGSHEDSPHIHGRLKTALKRKKGKPEKISASLLHSLRHTNWRNAVIALI
jgi:hypothetical protein